MKRVARTSWPRQTVPITDIRNVPKEWQWNTAESDLDESDIIGNIMRCRERISDGIMPQIFEARLARFEREKADQDNMIQSEEPDLSFEVVQRIKDLEFIDKSLVATGDKDYQLVNIREILKAYRNKKLLYEQGKVTFWSWGKQLCEPQRFDVNDFLEVNYQYHGDRSFWVEGIKIALRIPGSETYEVLDFLDDTGSDALTIFDDDLLNVCQMSDAPWFTWAPSLGNVKVRGVGGAITARAVLLAAAVLGTDGQMLTRWVSIKCLVRDNEDRRNLPQRLSGCWWRYLLYNGTAPDNNGDLHIASDKDEFSSLFCDVNHNEATGPLIA
ncbi:hypothetical protein N7462_001419 [Penicillium macrosclerotiorum]|uniref:uncharacterized protein n=1 Tax=Penicillium macrosclerotiorum TaxID=303699 RepID=UPI0025480F60|nr:uncharacterized protein N7462_001419 [Penicillium macrosclerotiorum]KAJ5691996.1 hypothetical protein N7462_001419 [Penicillium macrosclerotiorum]